MVERTPTARRRWSWQLTVLALVTLGLAGTAIRFTAQRPATRFTLGLGGAEDTRILLARALVAAAAERGLEGRLVELPGIDAVLSAVEAGTIDVAFIPGAVHVAHTPRVRQVTPLYTEVLHLLVRGELETAVGHSIGALRDKRVNLGGLGSGQRDLAAAVMAFGGMGAGDGRLGDRFTALDLDRGAMLQLAQTSSRDALPDATFVLATLPSIIARKLVRQFGYRVVPLPFSEAFALGTLADAEGPAPVGPAAHVQREYVADATIPPFTYEVEPGVPEQTVRTLGTRLVLVAGEHVHGDLVEQLLDVVYASRFAKIAHPPLTRDLLMLPPEFDLHAGTLDYLARDKPLVTGDRVDELSNTVSIAGAVIGGLIFVWQFQRQRRTTRRDETFAAYLLRVATIERRASQLELAATLALEPLLELQRQLVTIRGEVLDRFEAGELEGRDVLAGFLTHVNATREYLASLILHVRDNLEQQAETEGRSAQALWNEAVARSDAAAGPTK